MFSPNPARSTAGSGYTRARTPQGGMTQTALSAMFPTATTTEGLTATELASQMILWFFGRFDCLISIFGGFCGSVKFEPRSKKEPKNHSTNNLQ